MQKLTDYISSKINAKTTTVSAEEREDGIGVAVGLNYVVNSVFMTEAEAAKLAGVEIKISTGKVEASNEADAIAQVVKTAQQANAVALDVRARRYGSSNRWNIVAKYVK